MALPNKVNPADPLGSDSPAQGDDQLRGIKQYVVDVFGVPNNVDVTAPAMAITAGGAVTISQTPLTVPSLLRGTASQVLLLESQYSTMDLRVSGTNVLSANLTGVLLHQPHLEWTSGRTGWLGTKGAQPLVLRTNNTDRWQIDASGAFGPVASVLDLGSVSGPNPRNLYVGSNLVLGGQIQAGGGPHIITTPTGLLDLTKGAIPNEVHGDLILRDGSTWTRLAPGTSGYLLVTRGVGADPAWTPIGEFSSVLLGDLASNLIGATFTSILSGGTITAILERVTTHVLSTNIVNNIITHVLVGPTASTIIGITSTSLFGSSLGIANIEAVFDGGGGVIPTGIRLDLPVDFDGVIQQVTLVGTPSGSLTVDIYRSTFGNFPPAAASSLVGSGAKPSFTNAIKAQDSTLTNWNTRIQAGDILRFNVDSVLTTILATLAMKVRKL
jgi:hypothetical protein